MSNIGYRVYLGAIVDVTYSHEKRAEVALIHLANLSVRQIQTNGVAKQNVWLNRDCVQSAIDD
jgi:hypothetical protein